jgi:hypothetical protein
MQSPELREQTASEALTLEEEHQMQSAYPLFPRAIYETVSVRIISSNTPHCVENWQTDSDSNVSYG